MSILEGNVKTPDLKSHSIKWVTAPRGLSGQATVEVQGKIFEITYRRAGNKIQITRSDRITEFEVQSERNEDDTLLFHLSELGSNRRWDGLKFFKLGEEGTHIAALSKRKGVRIKSQMPGKIVKVLVKTGDKVSSGQVLLVMEAMKMENEIRSSVSGVIKKISVTAGQAVDSGIELMEVE